MTEYTFPLLRADFKPVASELITSHTTIARPIARLGLLALVVAGAWWLIQGVAKREIIDAATEVLHDL
jgi:hypothetical protein